MKESQSLEITVVIPMCNEQDNVEATVDRVRRVLDDLAVSWELFLVDDGSVDMTAALATALAQRDGRIRLATHGRNLGRGQALRTGFAAARGRFVITIDCDLSYDASYIAEMYKTLRGESRPDVVIASPYIEGGGTKGVPLVRLAVSRAANMLLSYALGGTVKTVTGIARGYRKAALDTLDLGASGKEIHLEIVSKALAIGCRIVEVPAVLKGRRKGRSKFRFRVTALSHLLFSYYEKPLFFFGILGVVLVLTGLVGGGALIVMWRRGILNPDRPLMTLVVILILGGIQVLSLGFVGTQIASMRRDIFRIQSQAKELQRSLGDTEDEEA